MVSEKILSICIPTYNRAKALDRLLGNLELEIKGISELLEICVSDNGSNDDTSRVLDRWEKKLPLARRKNEKNMGYDLNALEVTKMGSGMFLWHVGDDDLVVEGSVRRLVNDLISLEDKEIGVVYLNANLRNRWVVHFDFNKFGIFPRERIPAPLNISFGGSICLNRDSVRKVIEKITIKDGRLWKTNFGAPAFNDFVHTYLFMECLAESGKIGIEPFSGIRILADGGRISYRKKLYLELILVKYVLEMKKRYPWFKEAELTVDSPLRVIGRTFIDSGLALEDPSLEYLFQAYLKTISKIMVLEKRGFELAVISVMAWKRSIPVLKQLMLWSFLAMKLVLNLPFDKRSESNPVLQMNEEFALKSLPDLLLL